MTLITFQDQVDGVISLSVACRGSKLCTKYGTNISGGEFHVVFQVGEH